MTTFDALMPSAAGSSGGLSGGARPGVTGDWRQAVEQAQAKSWLRDRNLAPGGGPLLGPSGENAASSSPHRAEPRLPLTPPVSRQSVTGAEAALPAPQMSSRPAERVLPATVQAQSASVPMAPTMSWSRAPPDCATAALVPLAAAAAQSEALRGRARRQSIHTESGEQGVSVWIRDSSLNSQEARHLAAAIAAAVSSGRQTLAAFYLNGRPLADGSEPSSSPMSE